MSEQHRFGRNNFVDVAFAFTTETGIRESEWFQTARELYRSLVPSHPKR
jgi:hypothetical protein